MFLGQEAEQEDSCIIFTLLFEFFFNYDSTPLSKHILLLFVHYVCATLVSFEFLKLANLFLHLSAFALAIHSAWNAIF